MPTTLKAIQAVAYKPNSHMRLLLSPQVTTKRTVLSWGGRNEPRFLATQNCSRSFKDTEHVSVSDIDGCRSVGELNKEVPQGSAREGR